MNSDGKYGYSFKPDNLFAAYFPIHGYEDGGLTSSSGSGRSTAGISWIGQLYKRDEFVKRAAEIYFECFYHFLPLIAFLVGPEDTPPQTRRKVTLGFLTKFF